MTERRALTVLFADVSGSTRLFERHGDLVARRLIAGVLDALADVTRSHRGVVIKTIGDELMCRFPGALDGILAATAMQRRVKADPGFQEQGIAIRIGLHHGEVLVEGDDVFGDAVNTAARMAETTLARRDQVITTASTAAAAGAATGVRVRSLGQVHVPGKLEPIEIVDVLWQEDLAPVTVLQARLLEASTPAGQLVLRHRGRVHQVGPDDAFSIGRDPASTLVVEAAWASRQHALVEWRRGHFFLCDRSTNGTWLHLSSGEELRLHRDEMRLRGSGSISLGEARATDAEALVHFEVAAPG